MLFPITKRLIPTVAFLAMLVSIADADVCDEHLLRLKVIPFEANTGIDSDYDALLASGSMADLLTDGRFDFVKAEKTGALYLLKRLKIRETNRTFRDGTVEETIVYDATIRDKIGALHDLGTHHDLWNPEIDDPAGVLARILNIPKAQIPASLDLDPNAGAADGDVVDEVDEIGEGDA